MYLPKTLYEALPYAYLMVGALLVVFLDSPITFASGVLFYIAGAAVWVMRSSHRRKNSSDSIQNRQGRFIFPEWLYEYLPFIYIAFGLVLFNFSANEPLVYVPAVVLIAAGCLVWMIRAIYRSQSSQRVVG